MGSSDLADYYQEVFNFTTSMSIKFSPLADALNQIVIGKGYAVDDTAPATWKYYLNLTGQYHPTDTKIYIVSLDTQQRILFSPATLAANPKTAAAYTPGQASYAALCALYPDQVDLIKSIVYPAPSINSAITAQDFTILAYGTTLLEPDEYDIVLQTMQEFLEYIAKRWYFSFFSYEPYYTWTFWGLLWQQMVSVVLLARILAIRTSSVHSWHVWQYLASYGLSDYSDVLSRTQTMFLYRNMSYLIANRGKQTNLVILADYLLSDLGVGLYGRDIWQETLDGAATCQLTPQLVPVGVPTKYVNALPAESAETVSAMEQRLYSMGTEVDISAANMADMTVALGTTPLNTMPTKLLELRPVATDRKFAAFLNNFLLDSLIYAIATGHYVTEVTITEPTTSTTLSLTANEAIALYGYCAARALLQTPTNLPTQYRASVAFKRNPTIPTTVAFNGYHYPMSDFTNVANYLGNYAWPAYTLATPAEFTAVLSQQFLAALNQIQVSRLEEDTITNRALRQLTQSVTVKEMIPLNLAPVTTYTQWFFSQPPALQQMLTTFDSQSDPTTSYTALADLILSSLLPATPVFSLYGDFALTNVAYSKFKQLFVQLCSYNILFLDSDTTVDTGIFIGKTSSYTASRSVARTIEIPTVAPMRIVHNVTETTHVPESVIVMRSDPMVHETHSVTGGITVTNTTDVGGYHRMKLGPDVRPEASTISARIVVNLQKNDSYFLTSVS